MHQRISQGRALMLALAALSLLPSGAGAQFAVSANDGKAVNIDGVTSVPANPPPDYVAVIDLAARPPKIVGEVAAPASVVGPPQSVAVASDESFALVTSATQLDPADPKKVIPNDKLSVIDLKSSPPKVLQTLQAGKGAAGVSINRSGTLALVANRGEGTVWVFTIANRTLTAAGKVQLGDEKSGPSHVVFTPDGKTALVTRDGDNKISVLAIEGGKVEYTKRDIAAGLRPYGIEMSPSGDIAFVANIGVGGGDADTVSIIDLTAKPARVVRTSTVGQTPEGIRLSPDGQYLAVTVMNGSNKPKSSPFFNYYGLLKIFHVVGKRLSPIVEANVGHWCQGAAWSKDNKTLLVQCMVEKSIMVFAFNGKSLKPQAPIAMRAGPAAIRTAQW